LVRELGHPVMVTSVHDDDELVEYTTDPHAIEERLGDQVDLVIDGGNPELTPSTVIDCPGNEPVGNYWYTRNAVGCTVDSGPWMKLVDTCAREVPRRITIFDGHNGGPMINYPRQLVVFRTGCTNQC